MLSVSEISTQLNFSEQYVRRLIREGKIDGERVGKTWMVSQDSVDNISAEDFKTNNNDNIEDRISKKKYNKSKLNVLSFFSGALGLDLGLEKAGMNILLACENDKATKKTIVANEKNIGLIGNLLSYSVEQILAYANLDSAEQVDMIVGGPPCQAFSTAGKRMGFEDGRGNVFLKYLDVITTIKPRYIVIENVRGLMSVPMTINVEDDFLNFDHNGINGSSLYYVKKKLESAGYKISFNLYNSANFGVPQIRERVVIIGTLMDNAVPYLTPTHSENSFMGLNPWLTFKDAVKDVDTLNCDHVKFPEKRMKFIKMLEPGQNWKNLPPGVQQEAMGNSYFLGGGKTGFYRRLAWDRPSPTLVTHPAMPATELAHPTENRPLSVQEYKRVQQFPDNWEIQGTVIDQYRQIGNAVPVGLGYAIGKEILDHHKGRKKKSFEGFPFSRYRNTSDKDWQADFLARLGKHERLFS